MILTNYSWHVNDILVIAEEYIAESQHPYSYSREASLDYIFHLINDINSAIFLIYNDKEELEGGAIAHSTIEFQEQYTGMISKFYIRKPYRGTNAGRKLMKEVTDWFDVNDCILSFSSPAANIGADQLYINLLRKFGFTNQGRALVRPLNGGRDGRSIRDHF